MKKFIKRMSEDWYIKHEYCYCQQCGEIYDSKYYWYKDKKGINKLNDSTSGLDVLNE